MHNIYKLFLAGVVTLIWYSCEKDEYRVFIGSWVEVDTKTDTVVFNKESYDQSFILYRGTEERNGYTLPKIGSGPYLYRIIGDTISLYFGLSSSVVYYNYYFILDQEEQEFNIGPFTDFDSDKEILTFKKNY